MPLIPPCCDHEFQPTTIYYWDAARVHESMTKWARDATEFTVSVTRNAKLKTSSSYIPKPILDRLGTPKRITFVLQDGLIVVRAEDTAKS